MEPRPAEELDGFSGRLISMSGEDVLVKAMRKTYMATPIIYKPRFFPAGILDQEQNYIVLDEQGEVTAVVLWNVYGSDIYKYINQVCEDCFAFRVAGKRGLARQGGGEWAGIGYTTTFAAGKFG